MGFYYLIKALDNKSGFLIPVLLGLVAFFTHAVSVPIVLVILVAFLFNKLPNHKLSQFLRLNRSFWIVIVLGLLIIFIYQLIDRNIALELPHFFVLLIPNESNNYWFLSIGHILDFVNSIVFMTPLIISYILYIILDKENSSGRSDNLILLKWYCFFTIMITFWLDPTIGAIRDWDLLGLGSIPLTIFIIYSVIRNSNFKDNISKIMLPILALITLTIVPNIIEKQNIDTIAKRLDSTLWESPHYQERYRNSYRCISWAWLLENEIKNYELSKKFYWRSLESIKDAEIYHYLGRIYFKENNYDSTIFCYEKAILLDSTNCDYTLILGNSYFNIGLAEKALTALNRTESFCIDNYKYCNLKGVVLETLNENQEALKYMRKAYALEPNISQNALNLVGIYYKLQNIDSTYFYTVRILEIEPGSKIALQRAIMLLVRMGKKEEAEQLFNSHKKYHPNITSINQLMSKK